MTLPPRHKIESAREKRWRCPAHLAWVREFACSVRGCQQMPIEAAHVRCGTDGGTGMKPSDNWAISLCSDHHSQQHRIGEPEFERRHRTVPRRTLAGPLAMNDCTPPAAATAQEQRQPAPTAPREQNGERDAEMVDGQMVRAMQAA